MFLAKDKERKSALGGSCFTDKELSLTLKLLTTFTLTAIPVKPTLQPKLILGNH